MDNHKFGKIYVPLKWSSHLFHCIVKLSLVYFFVLDAKQTRVLSGLGKEASSLFITFNLLAGMDSLTQLKVLSRTLTISSILT